MENFKWGEDAESGGIALFPRGENAERGDSGENAEIKGEPLKKMGEALGEERVAME